MEKSGIIIDIQNENLIHVELIDTHCHLDFSAFDNDRAEVVNACFRAGIKTIVVPSVKQSNWADVIETQQQFNGILIAFGLHPCFIKDHTLEHLDALDNLIKNNKPNAVGEAGLDFYNSDADRNKQQYYFNAQLELAQRHSLPLLLHVRKAHEYVILALKKMQNISGIIHAFSGSLEQAYRYIDLGFKLGFGGTLTYAGSTRIRNIARRLPADSLVLETDAPDMPVFQHKRERNSPLYIQYALEALATIRNEPLEVIATQTSANARAIFSLDTLNQ